MNTQKQTNMHSETNKTYTQKQANELRNKQMNTQKQTK